MEEPPPPSPASPRLELLGRPRLIDTRGGEHALSDNDAALLLLLAFDRCRSRRRLAALVWPRAEPSAARNSLRQRLHRLGLRAGAPLVAAEDADTLRLLLPHDLQAPEAAWQLDPEALSGEPLGDADFEDRATLAQHVAAVRSEWRRLRARCLDRLADEHERAERHEEALKIRQRRCREDPHDAAARTALVNLLAVRGDYAAAGALQEHSAAGRFAGEEEQRLHQLRRAARDASVPSRRAVPPPLLLRPPRIVGREAERRAIASALAAGQAVLVSGTPGLGKSRLLAEFGAADGLGVRSRPGDAERPYALLERMVLALRDRAPKMALTEEHRAWLARAAPALGTPMGGPDSPTAMARALGTALRAAQVGTLLLDDLHNADAATLDLLPLLFEGPHALELLLAARRSEWPAALKSWHAREDGELLALELRPLAEADIDSLLDELGGPASGAIAGLQQPGLAKALHLHSGGNPLFVLETLRALWDGRAVRVPEQAALPLPGRLGDLLERRVARLPAPALQLAQLAALAGDAFDAELAAVVLDQHPLALAGAWTELERAEVLQGTRFSHDLLREACQRSVPAPVARALHARIAQALASRTPLPAAELRARQWQAAEAWAEAASAWTEAALASRRRRLREDELRCWRAAAQASRHAGAEAAALRARAEALEALIVVEGVEAALAEADRIDGAVPDEATTLRTGLARLLALAVAGRFAEARALAAAVVEQARAAGEEALRLRALLVQGQALGQTGEAAAGLALLEAANPAVQALGDEGMDYEYSSALAYLSRLNFRRRQGVAHLQRAVALAERLHDRHELVTALSSRSVHLMELGRASEALADSRRAAALRSELGGLSSVPLAVAELNHCVAAIAAGHLGEALQTVEAARRRLAEGEHGIWFAPMAVTLAQIYLQCGRYKEAGALLQAGDWSRAMPTHRMGRAMMQARLARLRGLPAQAEVAQLEQAAAQAPRRVGPALAALELAQHEDAATAVARLRAARDELLAIEHLGHALHAHGLLVARLFELDPAAAEPEARACFDFAREVEAGEGRPVAWAACGRVFEACGDRASVRAVLAAFQDWLAIATAPPLPAALAITLKERHPQVRWLLETARRHA
ncbi:MAG: AAA family ATPase [Rubrivivax sp.]